MIAHVRGEVASLGADHAVVDVGGVGYLLSMPAPDLAELVEGEEQLLHVHTHVREDQITLFGFVDRVSKDGFGRLISVTGVGPKLALAVLSTFSITELQEIMIAGNSAALKAIPGVGPKMARRLALELKDKLDDLRSPLGEIAKRGQRRGPTPGAGQTSKMADLKSALLNLGLADVSAETAVEAAIAEKGAEAGLDELIKAALASVRKPN